MLHGTYDDLFSKREDLAKVIWAGMDEDKFIGPCKVCEEAGRKHEDGSPNRLRIIEMRGGKRFVGCEGYNRDNPEDPNSCTFSRPLPGRGYELWRLEERCSICGETPRLKVKGFRGRPWNLCLNDDCPSMVEMREKRAERQKAKEEAEKRKAEAEANGTTSETNGTGKAQEGRAQEGADDDDADEARPSVLDGGRGEAPLPQPLLLTPAARQCSSPSKESTAPARAPRRGCSPTRSAPRRCCSASPAAPPAGERLRELLKDADGRARRRGPS